jgi:hypothetical protein
VSMSIGRYGWAPARDSVGIAVGIGAAGLVTAACGAAIIPSAYPLWRFGVIAVSVLIFAAVTLDVRATAMILGIGFLIYNGFLEDRLGQLTWHTDDVWRLLSLVVVAAWGFAVGESCRWIASMKEEKHGA